MPRGRVLAVVLTVIMVLTVGLMMLSPASAGAFPGRNGKIAFAAPADGAFQIFLMNPDGSGLQQLTHGTGATMPAWSADGTKIAYVNENDEVWVMKADGTGAYQVTGPNSYTPTWSPDGTRIAYQNGADNHLYYMSADGTGTPTQLTGSAHPDFYPSWSPDGTKIAFSRDNHLNVLTLATLSVNLLVATPSTEPCWSPDGSMIVFTAGGGIYVVSANGGTPTLIQSGPFFWPDWSPDGTKIVASITPDTIHIMNADGSGTPTDLTPGMLNADDPNFQPLPALPVGPVGGFMMPVNKLAVFAPYLALLGLVATVAVVVVAPCKKREN